MLGHPKEAQNKGSTHHTAKVASHEDVVQRGQLQVGGPQVPGQLEALAMGHTAAPVRRTQGTSTRRALVCGPREKEEEEEERVEKEEEENGDISYT